MATPGSLVEGWGVAEMIEFSGPSSCHLGLVGQPGALVLELLFVAGIGYQLARGTHPRMVYFRIPWSSGAGYPPLPEKYSSESPFPALMSETKCFY
ncbi:MAG TPA: hypothetical protein VJ761_14620 [Ktedonobacteraceae bacterium]|nr:hypothetical protein [Ktedonobacteraceae bacterium]